MSVKSAVKAWVVLGFIGAGAIATAMIPPAAQACTPHPDHPDGCKEWNRPNIPRPRGGWDPDDPWPPNCPQCFKGKLEPSGPVIQPAEQFNPQIKQKLAPGLSQGLKQPIVIEQAR